MTGFLFFVFGFGLAFGASSSLAPVFGWDTPFKNFVEEPSGGYAFVLWMVRISLNRPAETDRALRRMFLLPRARRLSRALLLREHS